MSNTHRATTLEQDQIPADLQRLADAIAAMPSEQSVTLAPWIDAVVESTKRRRRILSLVQDALSQLRLDMKYLMFDLEATRRERDEYQTKLEEFEGEI
jgi:cupin superfamily acireductone dioxygenase involved in methionine salvage